MNVSAVAASIVAALRACTNHERQAATANYYPSKQENLGVYAADMRRVVRAQRGALRNESAADVLALAQAIVDHNTLEGRQAAYEILAGHKAARDALDIRKVEALGQGIDNWASVDGFACWISGPCWRRGQIADSDIHAWARSRDPWWRRAALVSTVALNTASRGGKGDSPRTMRVCEMLATDGHVMVHKALSWALRELARWDQPGVQHFLQVRVLPALVRREVSRKISTGRKNG